MGNAVAGEVTGSGRRNKKKAKIMKINGEFFKLSTPAKVKDVTKDYPGHILLDSTDFIRYNLRGSQPLDPEYELQAGHIYLLFQLPEFPCSVRDSISTSLPRTRSGGSGGESSSSSARSNLPKVYRRSVSDLGAVVDGGDSGGALRVKLKLPKVEVEKIMEQSTDKAEVARRIYGLSSTSSCVEETWRTDCGRHEQLEAVARLW